MKASTLSGEARVAAASSRPIDNMPDDLDERLAPLVDVLSDFVREGDHLCYCPDDVLHLLPLQTAQRAGDVLARKMSVSRTHAARVLQQQLVRPGSAPDRAVVIEVPATVDAANPQRAEMFTRAGNWLRGAIKVTSRVGRKADVAALARTRMKDAIVHFATHGIYPRPSAYGASANPYRNSGLLLAAGAALPDLGAAAEGRARKHLLTPERLVQSGLRFDGAHVTLQACVSGLAREGLGGDALGLEWALFQFGASSILSTHWNVSAQTSSAFAIRFYARVLNDQKSRATAWRETVLEFLSRSDALGQPYHWSAFSLAGDWHQADR